MTFGVGTSTHRPKYGLWLGLYIITFSYMLYPNQSCGWCLDLFSFQTPLL